MRRTWRVVAHLHLLLLKGGERFCQCRFFCLFWPLVVLERGPLFSKDMENDKDWEFAHNGTHLPRFPGVDLMIRSFPLAPNTRLFPMLDTHRQALLHPFAPATLERLGPHLVAVSRQGRRKSTCRGGSLPQTISHTAFASSFLVRKARPNLCHPSRLSFPPFSLCFLTIQLKTTISFSTRRESSHEKHRIRIPSTPHTPITIYGRQR